MQALKFTIPGKPFAWRRARSNGKFRFKDDQSVAHEAALQSIVLKELSQPFDGPLRITVVASFCIPKSWSKAKRAAQLGAPHTQKPDLSNIVKQLEDGLNRIAWEDDSQIAEYGPCRKVWGVRDFTTLIIERLGE